MPLDDLFTLIKDLRERMDTHGAALRQSEALLRPHRPPAARARLEHRAPPLWSPSTARAAARRTTPSSATAPLMMVEAKKLDTPLRDVVGQGIQYCLIQGTAHFSVTDGRRWEIYETHRPVPIDDKRIASFDLKEQDPAEAALHALALWRPGVQAGYVAPGHDPVLAPHDPDPKTTPPRPDGYKWQPLSGLNPQAHSAPPTAIRFPDNSTTSATAWNSILIETVRWLINGNHLNATHCPIQAGKSTRYLVAATPVHSNGHQFFGSAQVGSLYVEKDWSARGIVRTTRSLVEHLGQDPSQFHVGFAPPK